MSAVPVPLGIGRAPGGRRPSAPRSNVAARVPVSLAARQSIPVAPLPRGTASEMVQLARRHAHDSLKERKPRTDDSTTSRLAHPQQITASQRGPRHVTSRGPTEAVEMELMEIAIPREAVGKVIGSRGSVINAIRAQSGAHIQLDKHADGSASLSVLGQESLLDQVVELLKTALEGGELSDGRPVASDALRGLSEARLHHQRCHTAPSHSMSTPRYRLEAEQLAEKWNTLRRAKDYNTADLIRERLRKAGFEPEELLEEIAIYGRSEEPHNDSLPTIDAGKEPLDPLGYRPTVERTMQWGPTDAAKNHKDGGTGGLLTLNYQTIEPLPPGIGFTVTSGNVSATAEPLLALKRLQEEEEERTRREIRERNAGWR